MKGIKDLLVLKDKNLGEIYGRKWQTILDRIGRREKVRESVRKILKIMKKTWENLFKTLSFRNSMGRNWALIDWKIDSIDRAPIELGRFKPKF